MFLEERYHELEKHSRSKLVHTCENDSKIFIVYPGYKATDDKFDFRVDLHKEGDKMPLSHANIITDIYNKCKQGYVVGETLKGVLVEAFKDTRSPVVPKGDLQGYRSGDPPQEELLQEVSDAHGEKDFKKRGNRWDLDMEELLGAIFWIVLQEDMNYPMEKGFLGRKMPLARYVEAIYCAENTDRTIDQVIRRAIVHNRRPRAWEQMDYSFLDSITSDPR